MRVLKLLMVLNDRILSRFQDDSVFFMFVSDRVLLRVLVVMVLYESSVIGSSSGSLVTDSSLGSSVLFFQHAAIFY